MAMNKNWLLLIPSILITIFLWNIYAFTKVDCICPWNEWGFAVATIASIIVFIIQGISIFILIKKQSKRIYAYYGFWIFVSVVVYIIIMRTFLAILT
jgi:membrane protease YdiL (CAAX protease family)